MIIEKGDVIRFENNSEYVVVDILEDNGKRYFYFSALDENIVPRFSIMKEAIERGNYGFSKLEETEFSHIKDEFFKKFINN